MTAARPTPWVQQEVFALPASGCRWPLRALVAAVKVMCTVGEIADVYREVFGQYRDPAWL